MTIILSQGRVDIIDDQGDREFAHEMLAALAAARPTPTRTVRQTETGHSSVMSVYPDGRITYDFVCEPGMSR